MSAADSTVFTDFCQAWGARFPGSQLPDAWEEDVRANLKKHTTKVTILREELEKEEMYVDYLETLLKDIERKKTSVTRQECSPAPARVIHPDDVDANKQAFLDSHLNELQKTDAFITVINVSSNEEQNTVEPTATTCTSSSNQKLLKKSSEVATVAASEYVNVTLSKSRDSIRSVSSPTTPPTSPLISSTEDFLVGREGLAAVNTSSISSSSDSTSSKDQPLADDLEEDLNHSNQVEDDRGQPDGRDFEEENNHLKTSSTPAPILRGNSAGKLESGEGHHNHHQAASRVSSVSQLRANWEGRPPVMLKPMAKSRSKLPLPQEVAVVQASQSQQQQQHHRDPPGRKDSDSSSRGRMGSPSGKSHDSSDSEHSWSRQDSGSRKQQRNSTTSRSGGASDSKQRSSSGAERLDRLVRKTSSSGSAGGGDGNKGNKKKPPQIQPRDPKRIISSSSTNSTTINGDEPLYDTVAADEIEDEYDNHLLAYSEKSSTLASGKTDTIGSGGNSSTDLGFDEPPMPPSRRGTLSSSDATISSFKQASEPEEDYVNLQYFLQQHRRRANTGSEDSQILPDSPLPTMTPPVMFQSDDELDIDDEEPPVVTAPEKPRIHKRQVTDELPKTPDVPVEDQGRTHDLGMGFFFTNFKVSRTQFCFVHRCQGL